MATNGGQKLSWIGFLGPMGGMHYSAAVWGEERSRRQGKMKGKTYKARPSEGPPTAMPATTKRSSKGMKKRAVVKAPPTQSSGLLARLKRLTICGTRHTDYTRVSGEESPRLEAEEAKASPKKIELEGLSTSQRILLLRTLQRQAIESLDLSGALLSLEEVKLLPLTLRELKIGAASKESQEWMATNLKELATLEIAGKLKSL